MHSVKTFGYGGRHFENKKELLKACKELITADTTILVKGSRRAAMEEVAESLKAKSDTEAGRKVR